MVERKHEVAIFKATANQYFRICNLILLIVIFISYSYQLVS